MFQTTKPSKPVYDGFIMQSLPRSGTALALDYTNGIGAFGHAQEYLNQRVIPYEAAENAEEHFQMAMKSAYNGADRFSMKLFPKQLLDCVDYHGYDFLSRCRNEYSILFVRLRRRDTIARAVSLFIALSNDQWATDMERKVNDVPYEFQAIYKIWVFLIKAEAFWDAYNADNEIEPIEFVYEALEEDPSQFGRKMCAIFDVDSKDMKPLRGINKQRNQRYEDYCARFRQELELDRYRDEFIDTDSGALELRKAPRTWGNLYRLVAQKPLQVRK